MNMRPQIHAIILTLNEEQHIRRCIESIKPHVSTILVVDSFSTDQTCDIALSLGAHVEQKTWINYATQFNFGVDLLERSGGWLLRIDADEILESADVNQLLLSAPQEVDGFFVKRQIHFMGKRIRFGGMEPSWQLRIWRNGSGQCENRWMDEHIVVQGTIKKSKLVISDINLNSLQWWTAKHNDYASREAIDILNRKHGFLPVAQTMPSGLQPRLRRLLKQEVYMRLPSGLRSVTYFVYRYVFRLGFLDGMPGAFFHLFQGLWYRSLVDAKVIEIEAYAKNSGISIVQAIEHKTGRTPIF